MTIHNGPPLQTAHNCQPKHTAWHQEIAKAHCKLIKKSPLGPNFFTTQGPESGAAERNFFVFWQQRNYWVSAQKCTTKLLDYRSEMYNEMIGLLLRNVQRNYSQQKLRTASRRSTQPAEAQDSQQKLRTQIGHLKGLRCCTGAPLNSFRQQKLTDRQQEPTWQITKTSVEIPQGSRSPQYTTETYS